MWEVEKKGLKMTAYVLVVVYETDLAFPLPSCFHCFSSFFIFVEIVLLLEESDTTIPILRQQGYKLIRYTLYGYHDSPFSYGSMYCLYFVGK